MVLKSDQDGIESDFVYNLFFYSLMLKSDQDGIERTYEEFFSRIFKPLKSDQDGIERSEFALCIWSRALVEIRPRWD